MSMLYDDEYSDVESLGEHLGGVSLGGVGTNAGAKHNPWILFQQLGKTYKTKEAKMKAYEKFKKALLKKKAPKEKAPKAKEPRKERKVPQKVAGNKSRYDIFDVRSRLFAKTAKHPLREYTEQEKDLKQAQLSAKKAMDITERRYQAGYVSLLDYLDMQRIYNDASVAYIQTRQLRLTASVDLFKSLGGGWQSEVSQ